MIEAIGVAPLWRQERSELLRNKKSGAPRRNRTGTPLRERDFESRASTSSARGANGSDHLIVAAIYAKAVSTSIALSIRPSNVSFVALRPKTTIPILELVSPVLQKLYDWLMSLAAGRHAPQALGAVSFTESSFFPIPPDVLLIPMVVARRQKWWIYATICTVTSVLGAFVGYAIGALLFQAVGQPILAFYGAEHSFERFVSWYDQWGGWGIFLGAVTPFPYKVLTIFSGSVGFNLLQFAAVSVVGRGLRFFLVSGLLYLFGEPIREFIEKRLGLMFILFCTLLIGGFVALKFLL